MVFIAALALIFESVRMARLADVMSVILLLLLENVSIGTVGCPRLGSMWKLFVVWSRLMLVPSESLSISFSALMAPPRRLTFVVSSPSGMEFFALNLMPDPSAVMEPYSASTELMYPFMERSLNVREGSLREAITSGPRIIPTLSMATLIVSEGISIEMSFRFRYPSRSALEKL